MCARMHLTTGLHSGYKENSISEIHIYIYTFIFTEIVVIVETYTAQYH